MIQELISTSAPRCLNGNAGFGIVAQTSGMAPNVSQAVNALSGYTHVAPPGITGNPVVHLHAMRRTGGMLRHVVSRVADCGNDYTGRSNRIAHHWIIEEGDVRTLLGGPAELAGQSIFRSNWNEKPAELPPKNLSAADVVPKKCAVWERLTGDAGWGGIVAEHAEKGEPISIIFTLEHSGDTLRALIAESLALLPSSLRWRTTFSTYYMKSHEASGDKIQIKCFLAGSEESKFVRQSPNTLVIDLRQRQGVVPAGNYVETARGAVKTMPNVQPLQKVPLGTNTLAAEFPTPLSPAVLGTLEVVPSAVPMPSKKPRLDYTAGRNYKSPKKTTDWTTVKWTSITLIVLALIVGGIFLIPKIKEIVQQQSESKGQSTAPVTENHDAQQESELEKLQKELQDARAESENKDKTIQEKDDEIAALTKDKTSLESENKNLKNENENIKKQLKEKEQTETDHAKKEQKQKEIANALANLPEVWEGLAVNPNGTFVQPRTLNMPEALKQYGKDVKIDIVPFVELGADSNVIAKDNPSDDTVILKYTTGTEIAKIEFKDGVFQFKWESPKNDAEGGKTDTMRILLSKLRVSIGDNSHDIALWKPLNIKEEIPSELKVDVFKCSNGGLLDFGDGKKIEWKGFIPSDIFAERTENSLNQLAQIRGYAESFTKRLDGDGQKPENLLKQTKIYLLHPAGDDKLVLMEATQ